MQVYVTPKKKLLGSSLAFTLKEGPVRCAKGCNKSWVILKRLLGTLDYVRLDRKFCSGRLQQNSQKLQLNRSGQCNIYFRAKVHFVFKGI